MMSMDISRERGGRGGGEGGHIQPGGGSAFL